MRTWILAAALACSGLLASCGGGGGGGGGSSSTPTPSSGGTTSTVGLNFVALQVTANAPGIPNILTTSVTICQPGTTVCTTVPNIQVDTGSSGLRILASALPASFTLPAGPGGAVGECTQFADGVVWGSVKAAEVKMNAEVASSVPVQLIGDPNFATIPTSCSNLGAVEDDSTSLGANGIIGIGLSVQDCGSNCASGAQPAGEYYACSGSSGTSCNPTPVVLAGQVTNPVAVFASDNNGTLITMASVPSGGAVLGTGTLFFGIGTQANNALGSATVISADGLGYFSAQIGTTTYPQSFLDTGSSAYFFNDSGIPTCTDAPQFYCPTTELSLTANITAANGTVATTVLVGNTDALLETNPINAWAFNDLAATAGTVLPDSLDMGLSYFFGRSVFTAITAKSTPGGVGPFYAITAP